MDFPWERQYRDKEKERDLLTRQEIFLYAAVFIGLTFCVNCLHSLLYLICMLYVCLLFLHYFVIYPAIGHLANSTKINAVNMCFSLLLYSHAMWNNLWLSLATWLVQLFGVYILYLFFFFGFGYFYRGLRKEIWFECIGLNWLLNLIFERLQSLIRFFWYFCIDRWV